LLEVHRHGGELEQVIVCKTSSHFNIINIRIRPIKRELKGAGLKVLKKGKMTKKQRTLRINMSG
jgi:hypothetical protein